MIKDFTIQISNYYPAILTCISIFIVFSIVVFVFRSTRHLHQIYHQALMLENAGDYQRAVSLYELLIEQCQKKILKQKELAVKAEQRLKALQKQHYFEQGFKILPIINQESY